METVAIRRIVLGFDGSEQSRDAAALARRLAAIDGPDAEVVVVVSFDYPPAPVTVAEQGPTSFSSAQSRLDEAERLLAGVRASTRAVAASSAARALIEVAEAESADVIVIGSTHRGRLGRVLPGSVGERLLHGAPCAVAVAPLGFAGNDRELRTIGAGYDGTSESRIALRWAAGLASRVGAGLELIGVMRPLPPGGARGGFERVVRAHLSDRVEAARAELLERDSELEVTTVLRDGHPAEELAGESESLDLLVVGSRGYGPLRRTMLGGVATEVIRTSVCPVLVAPRGARPPEVDMRFGEIKATGNEAGAAP